MISPLNFMFKEKTTMGGVTAPGAEALIPKHSKIDMHITEVENGFLIEKRNYPQLNFVAAGKSDVIVIVQKIIDKNK